MAVAQVAPRQPTVSHLDRNHRRIGKSELLPIEPSKEEEHLRSLDDARVVKEFIGPAQLVLENAPKEVEIPIALQVPVVIATK